MFCIKCGTEITGDSSFCTKCGEKVIAKTIEEKKKFWTKKKSLLLILLSIVLTSLVWVTVYGSFLITTEDESVNIITHLLETVGRQSQAWDKTEQIIELFTYGISDECINTPECVDDSIAAITTLRAEIEKERSEIDGLWSTGGITQDLGSYFSNLEPEGQLKIQEIFNVYFPEEADELTPSAKLL